MKKQTLTSKNVALGNRIKKIRRRAGLSQEQLGEQTRLTQTHISLLETGKRGISLKTLQRIANALDVRTRDLIPF